jgi:hypothetical protein
MPASDCPVIGMNSAVDTNRNYNDHHHYLHHHHLVLSSLLTQSMQGSHHTARPPQFDRNPTAQTLLSSQHRALFHDEAF